MGVTMYSLNNQSPGVAKPATLQLPKIKLIHKPAVTEQTIKDASRANDLLLGLRIYLTNRTSN